MLKPPSPGNAPNEAMTQAPRRARVGDHPVRGLGIETCKGSSIPQVVSRDTGEQIGLAALRAPPPEEAGWRGLAITEDEVDRLMERLPGCASEVMSRPVDLVAALDRLTATLDARRRLTRNRRVELRLESLARRFGLDDFELTVLLVALAPELDLRYQRFYAHLQDDVTRKRPTVDLVLSLSRVFDSDNRVRTDILNFLQNDPETIPGSP